jgi:hypothetical protein
VVLSHRVDTIAAMPAPVIPQGMANELNRKFYAYSSPYEYFIRRLLAALLWLTKSDALVEMLQGGISYGPIELNLNGLQNPAVFSEETQGRYGVAEAEILLHHASESLLRLYLAHDGNQQCPWLELANLRSFSEFKKRVDDRFRSPGRHSDAHERVRNIFLSAADIEPGNAEQEALMAKGAENLELFLEHFGRRFLEDSNLYNSTKHGFGVGPGHTAVTMTDDDTGDTVMAHAGPSIHFLERKTEKNPDRTTWHETTQFVDIAQTLTFAHVAIDMLDALWSCARLRYLRRGSPDRAVFCPADFTPQDIIKELPEPAISRFSATFFDSLTGDVTS